MGVNQYLTPKLTFFFMSFVFKIEMADVYFKFESVSFECGFDGL